MATGVGLLCSRVRVEEKGILAALASAGIPGCIVPPDQPLPPISTGAINGTSAVVLDRCASRAQASVLLPLMRMSGATTIDAGLAATEHRVAIGLALRQAGLPRPAMQVAIGETAALATFATFGSDVTLLPLTPGSDGIILPDLDTAEAVFEHRAVLGGASEAIFLLQQGAPAASDRVTMIVVGSTVAGVVTEGIVVDEPRAAALATRAARVLRAGIVGIELVWTAAGWMVWDAVPVPDFRAATPTGDQSVADAVVAHAMHISADAVQTIAPFDLGILQRVTTEGLVDGVTASI